MDNSFYELATLCYKERIEKQFTNNLEYESNKIMIYFKCWCNSKGFIQYNEINFRRYCLEEKLNIDFWIKKYIFEKYFDYEFTFDHIFMKWKAKKVKKNFIKAFDICQTKC